MVPFGTVQYQTANAARPVVKRAQENMGKPSPWELWTLNFELTMAVMAEVEPEVREQGLEMKEFFLLGKLDDHPHPADLARALLTPKPTITFMVKRMEEAGFI